MRAVIRRDVMVQRPTIIQALRTATEIADTGARIAGGGQPKSEDAPLSSHMTELRAMFAGMEAIDSGRLSQTTDNNNAQATTTTISAGNQRTSDERRSRTRGTGTWRTRCLEQPTEPASTTTADDNHPERPVDSGQRY